MQGFYIVISLLIFGFLIFIHEFGHFISAKLLGVRVNEFAINMGPKLFGWKRGETQYSVRLIPIGGYCAMEGEDEDTDDPRSFLKAAWWKRLIILCAGAFMNLLTGFLVMVLLSAFCFRPPITSTVSGFMEEGNTVEEQGLRVGDEIYALNGQRIFIRSDFDLLESRLPEEQKHCDLTVRRKTEDGQYELVTLYNFDLTRKVEVRDENGELQKDEEGNVKKYLGIYFATSDDTSFSAAIRYATIQCYDFTRTVWYCLHDMVTGKVGVKEIGGPLQIVDTMTETGMESETVQDGVSTLLYIGAFLAVNLAVMNMLPIPALDGGRVLFLLINTVYTAITKKKIHPKYEMWLNGGALILLLGLMAIVFVKDFWTIFLS